MKTVKEVAELTGISIRTLRYYDEIGLLKPAQLSDAGYRLYDGKALERLQEIMFFRELEVPLVDIKQIMDNPNHDRKQILMTQKALLEQKRDRLNGIIELITDVMEGVSTMSFEAFNDDDITKMVDHMLECMKKESLDEMIQKYGNIEDYRRHLSSGFTNDQATSQVIRWYGGKEKAVEAVLQSTGDADELKQQQDENAAIYQLFTAAKENTDADLAKTAVVRLGENYKKMFKLDNARSILLDLAKEYLQNEKLAEITDRQYGPGIAEYVANAINHYYGI